MAHSSGHEALAAYARPPALPPSLPPSLPLVLRTALVLGAEEGGGDEEGREEEVAAEVKNKLRDLQSLRREIERLVSPSSLPPSSSAANENKKETRQQALARVATKMRREAGREGGRGGITTPLLLAVEPLLTKWLEEREREEEGEGGEESDGERREEAGEGREGGREGGGTLSAMGLAWRLATCTTAEDTERLLTFLLAPHLERGRKGEQLGEGGLQQQLFLFVCALAGEEVDREGGVGEGMMEVLAVGLFESRPSLLIKMMMGLEDVLVWGGRRRRRGRRRKGEETRWFWRGRFEEEEGEGEEMETETAEEEEEEGGVEGGRGDNEERKEMTRRHTVVRTLYQRVLRLLSTPPSLPPSFAPSLPPSLSLEREEVYLALLEGAEQFEEMTRFLLRRREGGREGRRGWQEALGVLDRLREEGKGGRREGLVAARHGVFVFLLEAALRGEGGREGGKEVEDVMSRRPPTLQAQDVRLIGQYVLEEEGEMGEGGRGGERERSVRRAVSLCVEILEVGGGSQGKEGR